MRLVPISTLWKPQLLGTEPVNFLMHDPSAQTPARARDPDSSWARGRALHQSPVVPYPTSAGRAIARHSFERRGAPQVMYGTGSGRWGAGPSDTVCSPAWQVGPASLGKSALGPNTWASRAQTIGPHPGLGEKRGRESEDDA